MFRDIFDVSNEIRGEFPITSARFDKLSRELDNREDQWSQLIASEVNELIRLFRAWSDLERRRRIRKLATWAVVFVLALDIFLLYMLLMR